MDTSAGVGERWRQRSTMQNQDKTVIKQSKRAYFLLSKRRYREAEKIFLEAYGLDPNNAYILVGLGDVSRKLKKFEKALDYYEKCLEIDPRNVFALRGAGNAYRGLQQPEKSMAYWQRGRPEPSICKPVGTPGW